MEDEPARTKESERTQSGDFHEQNNLAGCSRASGAIQVLVPVGNIFMETSNISGFYLGLPLLLLGRHRPANISFIIILDTLRDFLEIFGERKLVLLLREKNIYILWRRFLKPLCFLFIDSDMFSSSIISVFSLFMAE